MTPSRFRALFPALAEWAWLDSPGSPPAAAPVVEAVGRALQAWSSGDFDWRDWQDQAATARREVAGLVGGHPDLVVSTGSLAEAAGAVARAHPGGEVLVLADEFRSNLLPWQRHPGLRLVPRRHVRRTDDLLAAIRPRTSLVAVSHVTTLDGDDVDLQALRRATDAVGARLFVNLTQSFGALALDLPEVGADFVAMHGYKWMLAPRGAAWLCVRPDAAGEVTPAIRSWTSSRSDRAYFGDTISPLGRTDASDGAPAWLSSIGAVAALRTIGRLDMPAVDRHVRALASRFRRAALDLGLRAVGPGGTHIEVFEVERGGELADALVAAKVRALVHDGRLRIGIHYFVDSDDIERALTVLSAHQRRA